jgi:hypothetical protein
MTCFEVKWTRMCGALLAVLATSGAGCGSGPDAVVAEPTSQLRNGGTNTYRLKGLLDLSDAYNDRTPDLSGRHCSGVMLNATAFLTTARCAQRVLRPGLSLEASRALFPDVYEWLPNDGMPSWYKHCIWSSTALCSARANAGLAEGDDTKVEQVSLYTLTTSPDKDLALITLAYYPDYSGAGSGQNNFADLYVDDFSPATMPRLQLYGWGHVPGTAYPLAQPRTGTMQVATVTPSRVDLRPDQVQACSGDEGGAWTIPDTNAGSAYEVVALESSYTADPSTGCSQSGSLDHATRLRDKMPWIESIVGTCGSFTDAGGHNIKRCYAPNCDGAPSTEAGWDGCRGSGCAVCGDALDNYNHTGPYPHYFEHHRNCSRNTTCGGYFYRCSSACPPPTDADK